MKKLTNILVIILVTIMALSINVQAAQKQPEFPNALKRGGFVVSGDYDGNYFVPKSKYNPDDLATYSFTSKTTFEGNESAAKKILDNAKNPGLGVRGLHKQGFTGKGVSIAYIGVGIPGGNPTNFTHLEFRDGMIKEYVSFGTRHRRLGGDTYTQVSALTGKTVGTAPDVNLYYIGVGSTGDDWKGNFIKGIDWVIEKNKTLPKAERIRIIVADSSMCNRIMNPGYVEPYLQKLYPEAIERAEKAGIIFMGGYASGYITEIKSGLHAARGHYDAGNPDDVNKAKRWNPGETDWGKGPRYVHAATSRRTLAWGDNSYVYDFADQPQYAYLAGIIAMGYQANPDISRAQITALLLDTRTNQNVVNPPEFIETVKKAK